MTYKEAQEFIKNLKIYSEKDFENFVKKGDHPPELPIYPSFIYSRKGWSGWGNFVGK
jgi:hypothetical protein